MGSSTPASPPTTVVTNRPDRQVRTQRRGSSASVSVPTHSSTTVTDVYSPNRSSDTASRPGPPPPGTAPGASTHSIVSASTTQTMNSSHTRNAGGVRTVRRRSSCTVIAPAAATGATQDTPRSHHTG